MINRGAEIDKFGGDLNSTPLHWATRYEIVYKLSRKMIILVVSLFIYLFYLLACIRS